VENPFARLSEEKASLVGPIKYMGVESSFNQYVEDKFPEWRELGGWEFCLASRIAFRVVVCAKMANEDTTKAEVSFLALSRVTDDEKSYKEVASYFDEIWDGRLDSVYICVLKAVGRYNYRFTKKRQRV
jgi:hypothetical protein